MTSLVLQGIWRVSDPKITLASAASLLVGLTFAAHDGPMEWGWAALCVVGIFFLEAAKNASGELFDWDSGDDLNIAEKDRSPFSGGKRVLVDRLMTRGQAEIMAVAFYLLGATAGLLVVAQREPRILWIGFLGGAIAFFYHSPPFKLSYRGLGELAVALAYGPLIAAGAYLVQRGTVSAQLLQASIPLGLLIAAFLFINEFPDCEADAKAAKRTLVVRLGKERASRWFGAILLAAFALAALFGIWGGFIGLPLALRAAWRVRQTQETAQIIPAQAWTLFSFVLFAIGAGAGIFVF
jgi:1,4-dihydroxy-2-naphthoate octaprenyltransferase